MSIKAELLLRPDVELFSVRHLPADIRATIDASDEDFALTRPHSRSPSQIVNKESADLLGAFRTPVRIVEAVLSYAGTRGLDPEHTLEQAYPLLDRLYTAKILVPPHDPCAGEIEGKLRVGMTVGGFRLVRCMQVLEDNEVFLGRSPAGQYAAVKFYRKPSERIVRNLRREAAMMRRAQKNRAPEFFSLIEVESGQALVSEWIFGSVVTNAGALLRSGNQIRSEYRLLALCAEMAAAFADLHDAGVLHGDVHPKNVLVEACGTVKVIDFGLAKSIKSGGRPPERGGVAFYFDPEFAKAQRDRTRAPLTPAGEQYSVASLLYQLWTGVYYLDWSLERTELLRQIAEEPPVHLEKRGVPVWRALEAVLFRALSKHPEARFSDMRAFANALFHLLPIAEKRDRNSKLRQKGLNRESELLERLLHRYSIGGEALRDGLSGFPYASINYGASGIAYTMFEIAKRRCDARLLALADVWIQKAYNYSEDSETGFYNPQLKIVPRTVGKVSLYHSPSGLHCVRALISGSQANVTETNNAIIAFCRHAKRPCEVLDLTLGKGSLLVGCAELIESMPKLTMIDVGPLLRLGDEIKHELLSFLRSEDLATSNAMNSLGIAHGWGGLLFALLRWGRATDRDVDPIVMTRLEELALFAEPHGGGVHWPSQNSTASSISFMDGWCNGTAGHAMLFALASEVYGSTSFVELAERAAASASSSEMRYGTLCCGLAGISYALLAVWRVTGSDIWLDRARSFARRAAADNSSQGLRDALYKGSVGVALLAEELQHPEAACMPLFESTRPV